MIEDSHTSGRENSGADQVRPRRLSVWKYLPEVKPGDSLLLSFLIPVLVMIVVFALRGIYPFGSNSFLRTDLYHQYAPFFSEFQYKLQHGKSLFYSWDVGMGVNFSALYAYYLASPANWLIILCPKAHVIEFITSLVVLKIGLCGLTFTWYIQKHFGRRFVGASFFGVFYALSGYIAAYSWNIMWLDCIWLFPLIMYGLERLVFAGKPFLYAVTLGLSILSNYYISIMICIFMVIYAISLEILKPGKSPRAVLVDMLRFALYSLLAGMMAAAILLPEIAALRSTASGDFDFPKTVETYFPIFDMIARHLCGVEVEEGLDHWPNVFCSTAVFLFIPLYFMDRRVSLREKCVYGVLLVVFYASFSVNVLNFIWHGFHYPNSLPSRQSFIYIFLLLTMSARAYLDLRKLPARLLGTAFAAAMGFVLLGQKLVTDDAFHDGAWYGAMLLLGLYALLLYYRMTRQGIRRILGASAFALVIAESLINTAVTSVPTTNRTTYKADDSAIAMLTSDLSARYGFYRIDKVKARTKNDGAWMNFPTSSLFSSVASAGVTDFFRSFGCEGSTNAYSTVGATPLTDALFATQYTLTKTQTDNPHMHLLQELDAMSLYENEYVLPLGFGLPGGFADHWDYKQKDPAAVQNDFANALGARDVLDMVSADDSGSTVTFTADQSGEYYIYVGNSAVKKVELEKDAGSEKISNVNRGFFVETGWLSAGEMVTLRADDPENQDLRAAVYRFNYDSLAKVCDTLSQETMTVTEWKDSRITGEVTMREAGTLFLSIPYDSGWRVTIDGNKSIIYKMFDAFSGIDLEAGTHTIALCYTPQGFRPGICISLSGLLLLGAAWQAEHILRGKRAAGKRRQGGNGTRGRLRLRSLTKKERADDYGKETGRICAEHPGLPEAGDHIPGHHDDPEGSGRTHDGGGRPGEGG
ncbi:YfhO family protein [Clostridium vitabionis]|uniref:YfhO family protein n=1 Tax=Clostridium vitabionis TaxID=2784388 RepID=UPI00188C277A|nr:YfhO family protein [Clostridium vitabionis]